MHCNCNISASYSSNIPTHNSLSCKFERTSVVVRHKSNTLSYKIQSENKYLITNFSLTQPDHKTLNFPMSL